MRIVLFPESFPPDVSGVVGDGPAPRRCTGPRPPRSSLGAGVLTGAAPAALAAAA